LSGFERKITKQELEEMGDEKHHLMIHKPGRAEEKVRNVYEVCIDRILL
jgi:hypothetical protein